jgi:hypothetical protein
MEFRLKERTDAAYDQWTPLLAMLAMGAWGMLYLGYQVMHATL